MKSAVLYIHKDNKTLMVDWKNNNSYCALGVDLDSNENPIPKLVDHLRKKFGIMVSNKDLEFKGILKYLKNEKYNQEEILVFETKKYKQKTTFTNIEWIDLEEINPLRLRNADRIISKKLNKSKAFYNVIA